jgi:glucose/arabinose dehydrogenase
MKRLVTVGALLSAACLGRDTLKPPDETPVTLVVQADVSAAMAAVTTVVVEVTAIDIAIPLLFNIPVSGGAATGTMTLPAGSGRTITMHAYDSGGIETHRGSITTAIRPPPAANPTISLTLAPLAGDVPIGAQIGSFLVTVAPGADTVAAGGTATLTATIVTANGDPVDSAVIWASLDPRIATVARIGPRTAQVTAVASGTTTVVAVYGGSAGSAAIVVPAPAARPGVQLVAQGLTAPDYVTQPPGDTSRLFIVEQPGRIRLVTNGTLVTTPFLDITSLVAYSGERGLFSMVFHPSYASNGYFYVVYTENAPGTAPDGDLKLVRYRVSGNPDVADPASAFVILTIPHTTYDNHNGALVAFGADGYLYVSVGDGGGGGDPLGNAQNTRSLLGKVLRLDVNGGSPYAIPADNPFATDTIARREIWAYGLRNPWRYSFDRVTHDLYIADVGQNSREEVDVQPAASGGGENYGWNVVEGTKCYTPATGCVTTGFVPPVLEYDTHVNGTCSITGGYVYRGSRLPSLVGHYFYGDYCARWIKSFRYVNGVVQDQHDYTAEFGLLGSITSFGEDSRGELYVVVQEGRVYRILPVQP